jgi:hypothetical protein
MFAADSPKDRVSSVVDVSVQSLRAKSLRKYGSRKAPRSLLRRLIHDAAPSDRRLPENSAHNGA